MDYFVWAAVCQERTVVIDTGFTEQVCCRRGGRTYLRCPIEGLSLLGIAADQVSDVVLTHLHYDHAGNFERFPNARFHLQEAELHYATGKYMRYPRLSHSFEVDDVCGLVKLNYRQRVHFHGGDGEVAPGISVHYAGGHTAGLQFVRVRTARGWVVLASDVSHFYENFEKGRPFSSAFHVGQHVPWRSRPSSVPGQTNQIGGAFPSRNCRRHFGQAGCAGHGVDGVTDRQPGTPLPAEMFLLIECIAPTAARASEVMRTMKQYLLHFGYEGRLSTGGNLAFPFTPPEVSVGPAYKFNIYHVLESERLDDLFPLTVEQL